MLFDAAKFDGSRVLISLYERVLSLIRPNNENFWYVMYRREFVVVFSLVVDAVVVYVLLLPLQFCRVITQTSAITLKSYFLQIVF